MTEFQGPVCHSYGIRGWGDPTFGVAVVGIAPGRDEAERTGRPFTGSSGKLLDSLLNYAGWHRDKTYTTNVLCWFNNTPDADELEECRPRLTRELRLVAPKLIVAMGAVPSEHLLGRKRRKGQRGAVMWSDYWGAYVLDTHHPSFALQSKSMSAVQDIIRDLSKIPTVLEWPANAAHTQVTFSTVTTLEEAQRALNALPRDTPVTLDIETSNPDIEAIDPYSDQLLRFSTAYNNSEGREHVTVFRDSCFPLCVRTGNHIRAWESGGRCNDCNLPRWPLAWPDEVEWTFQAGQFDIPALYIYFGQVLQLKGDTMLMSACTDERPGYHGLKGNGREWLGAGWWEDRVKPFYKGKLNQVQPDDLDEYNAKDAAYTLRLVPTFWRKMQADDTTVLYERTLLPAMQTFIQMQIRGINVDFMKLGAIASEWVPRYYKTYRKLQLEAADIGWPTQDININSNPQLARLLYDIAGLDVTKLTKGGKPAVDKETLDRMDHPFAAKLRAYRTLDGMLDYVAAVYQHMKWDGKLHPSAFVTTTRTGRTSYRDPAMQTLPKDYTVGEDYARLREIVIPHNPSTHEIIEADYNQIEVWLAWAYSRDPVLLEHLQSGDVHSATAEGAFNTKRELHTPAAWATLRQNAKKIRFGIQYGEGAEKLASPPPVGIGGSVADAARFITNFKRTYPTYTAWMVAIQHEAATKAFLRAPDGRVMRFPLIMDHKELRQAINFPIQYTASGYNLGAMVELEHPDFNQRLRELNSFVLLNVHDCLVVESDRRYRDHVVALMREVMEKPRFDGFPSIKVDVKVGDNLGKVAKLK